MTYEIAALKKKAARGVIFLVIKRFVLQGVFTGTNIILARLLTPEDFGAFATITFISTLLLVFTDLGLRGSLVQKKHNLEKADLDTTFTVGFGLSFFIALASLIFAPIISDFFNFGENGTALFRIYSLFFLLTPFKTTAGAVLERNLEYKKLVTTEITEAFVGAAVTVVCALLGFGVFSFVYGSLVGHLVGAILYFVFHPWRLYLKISLKNFSSLGKFGIPYQTNTILGIFYGPVILLYFSKIVGSQNVGFYQFAAGISTIPLLFTEIIQRVVYPFGARISSDSGFFKKVVEQSFLLTSLTTLPIVIIAMVTARSLIHFIYTDRWLPALPALYLGLVQIGIMSFTGLCGQFLFSLGQAKTMRNIAIIWALLTWIISPVLIYFFNFVGMSLSSLLVTSSGLWLVFRLKKETNFEILSNFVPYFGSSIVSGVLTFLLLEILPKTFMSLVIVLGFGFTIYFILILLFAKKSLIYSLNFLLGAFKKVSN